MSVDLARRKTTMARCRAKSLAEMQADPHDRRHGTRTGYLYGCRCDRCRRAQRDYSSSFSGEYRKAKQFKQFKELLADPDDPRHGTKTGYAYGCRCEECRKANSDYERGRGRRRDPEVERERRRLRLAEMQADPHDRRHGTPTGYSYGCRCEMCRAAGRVKYLKRHARELKKRAHA